MRVVVDKACDDDDDGVDGEARSTIRVSSLRSMEKTAGPSRGALSTELPRPQGMVVVRVQGGWGCDHVMLLLVVGSVASFRDKFARPSRFGDPENKGSPHRVNHRISIRHSIYFAYCYNLGMLARVICGGGLCEEASRVQEAIRTTKVDNLPLQVIYGQPHRYPPDPQSGNPQFPLPPQRRLRPLRHRPIASPRPSI